ncbi:Retrovirus-related Pol polyprotein from type-1 retrotransposable element R1 [Araneus ventricosus]|uniref:Retrovirus-related Pol polyprotein from type-1 retrotransposable element R1 n=1 Tax=Araneus ventricosus TaxID=182803 RepID=A0A4Y2S8P6_ARAVE|nr:Retrovirus-related Pol polyprotein from type-1 retrotransposable element R1 [Araneus ventricosus]
MQTAKKNNNSNWQVLEDLESYSDHKFIRIIINRDQHILSYNRFKTIFGGHKKFQNIIKLKAQNILQRISNTNTPEELDDLTTFLQQEINMACRKSYKLKKTPSTPIISWWNPQLETRKKEISALKRRAQRSFDAEKAHFQLKAKIKQSIFKKEVLSAKRNCFKRNCTQDENVYGKFFKIAFKNSAPPTDLFTLIDNQQRGSPRDIAKSILKTLYPTTIETTNQIQSPKQPIIEPPFTNKELKEIIRFLPTNKAPGNDGIDFIIIKQLFQACPSILRNYYNKCLHLQKFPTPLKEGIIVLFHKKGKEERNISSYRPITLLPTLGKILEKLLLQRFNYTLEKEKKLHKFQFGFREGKSVDLALHSLISKISEAKQKGLQTLFISIDIKGAFDNLLYSSIKNSIDNITNKTNVTESLKDILSNRKVIIQTQEGPAIWQQTKGCAQGSCSGPAFWNLVADNILKADWPQNVHLQAFADDFAFVISHKTKDGVQQLANRAIKTFSNWAELNKLQISLEKTKYMYLGNLINPARIKWNNTRIQKVSTLRYLGIIIDDKLKWIPHIKEKGTKALQQYQHFQRIAGKNWGLTTANRKLIYKTVIERMLCHGAVAWAQKITESMKRKLNTIQRKFLLLITKAYHTTATNSLQVITGIPPLHLTANKEAKFIKISRLRLPTQVLNTPLDPTKYEVIQRGHQMHPAKFLIDKQITTQPLKEYPTANSTYTDGSKNDDGTGSAFCCFDEENRISSTWMGKLSKENNVFQAELQAILQAIKHHENASSRVNIWSDSLSSLQAIQNPTSPHPIVRKIQLQLQERNNINIGWIKAHTGHLGNESADVLAKRAITEGSNLEILKPISHLKYILNKEILQEWKKEWDKGTVGRLVHEIIPIPSFKLHNWSRYEIMFFSEHGPFTSYLKRFNLRNSDLCSCGEIGTPLHFATSCILTESWHFKKPSDSNILQWKLGILKNTGSRTRLKQLLDFIIDNDFLINGPSSSL